MLSTLDDNYKNPRITVKNTIEIDKRENIYDILINTIIMYQSQKFTGTKKKLLQKYIMVNVVIFLPFGTRKIFQHYHPGYFMADATQNLR